MIRKVLTLWLRERKFEAADEVAMLMEVPQSVETSVVRRVRLARRALNVGCCFAGGETGSIEVVRFGGVGKAFDVDGV
jgi:hypothetical protein